MDSYTLNQVLTSFEEVVGTSTDGITFMLIRKDVEPRAFYFESPKKVLKNRDIFDVLFEDDVTIFADKCLDRLYPGNEDDIEMRNQRLNKMQPGDLNFDYIRLDGDNLILDSGEVFYFPNKEDAQRLVGTLREDIYRRLQKVLEMNN